jgi:AcrR family transcriptional regulator
MVNQRRRSATRGRLIEAAMRLFWEKGYGSTSVADILQAAQVNSGSLYHLFPGKQELLIAVLERYRDGLQPMLLEPAWKGVADPIERIFALLARYRRSIVQTDCTYGCPIGSLALEIHEPDPPVRRALAANFAAWTAAVEGCLEAAGPRIPEEVDRRELAELVLTVMEGAVMQARTHRDVAYFDRTVHQLRAYFDRLVQEAAGRPPGRPKRAPSSPGRRRQRNPEGP